MIVSVSRRTDVPALYSDWFFHRLHEGFALVRNPMNPHQVSRVALDSEHADAFVFWSKNPAPMLPRLHELGGRPYVFQFTLTPYGTDIEGALPDKRALLRTFAQLADALGPERVIWRYDPILFTPRYDEAFHLRAFEAMVKRLYPHTRRVTVSFIDPYRHIQRAVRELDIQFPDAQRQLALLGPLAACARSYGLAIDTCCEAGDFSALGVTHAHCIDAQLLGAIAGLPAAASHDAHQRENCGCAASVDIGVYDTCTHSCRYCYATHNLRAAQRYDEHSPLLCSSLLPGDVIRDRAMPAAFDRQISLCEGGLPCHEGKPL